MTLHLPSCPCQKPGSASWHTFSMTHVSSLLAKEVKVKVTQSCPTFCDSMDYTVHGILQARTLEWVAFPVSRGSSQSRDQTQVCHMAGGFFTSWSTRLYTHTHTHTHVEMEKSEEIIYIYHHLPACLLSGFSHVQLFANLWTIAHQAPVSTGFSRQEYWRGLPRPSSGDLPYQHLLCLLHWQVASLSLVLPPSP